MDTGTAGPGETTRKIGSIIGDIVGAAASAVTGGAIAARPTLSKPPKPGTRPYKGGRNCHKNLSNRKLM